ncbi:MAG: ATP-binding protein [Patescibacteria group bacterium]
MISEKYKDLYLTSTQEQLKELADWLLILDKNPQDQATVTRLAQSLHSMKGSAAMMGYKQTVDFVHDIESVVQAAGAGHLILSKDILDLLFRQVDLLNANLQSIQKNDKQLDFSQSRGDLQNILQRPLAPKSAKTKDKIKTGKAATPSIVAVSKSSEITVTDDKFDKVQNIVDDLLVNIMAIKAKAIKLNQSQLLADCVSADTLVNNLRRELERLRIVSLAQAFSSLPYLVRSVAKDEDKKIDFIIEDNKLSLNKSTLDELLIVVVQLVKNSIVHGIWLKQKNGQVKVSAILESDQIVIKVSDNGRGIDWQKVVELAIKHKMIDARAAKKLTTNQLADLLFQPGMSSQSTISTNAGRGVGLSLVKSKVLGLHGQISVSSQANKGTVFTITLPLTLSVFRSITFQVGDWSLAIPLAQVDKLVKLDDLRDFSKDKFFVRNQRRLQLLSLNKVLALPHWPPLAKYVLYIKNQSGRYALPIAGNLKESELVMKKSPTSLRSLDFIRGVGISSAGRPILILDVNKLI